MVVGAGGVRGVEWQLERKVPLEGQMVIGPDFAWAHFPKAAGDATLELFRRFPQLIVYADERHSPEKHTRFAAREADVDGKLLVMNIRRLPSWILSYAHHRARDEGRAPSTVSREELAELVERARPDGKLAGFTGDGRFPIDVWLRTESLAADFIEFVSRYATITPRLRRQLLRSQPVNAGRYDRSWANWFTPRQISDLYEHNPLWASIEMEVYGVLAS